MLRVGNGKDDRSTFEDVKLDFACKNSIETRSKLETVLSIDFEGMFLVTVEVATLPILVSSLKTFLKYPTVVLVGRDRKRRW